MILNLRPNRWLIPLREISLSELDIDFFMRILIKLEIRRQAESVAISRTRLSDTGQVGTSFDAIGYGSDFSGTVAFGAVAV